MEPRQESQKEKVERILKAKVEYQEEWLRGVRETQEVVPLVQQSLEMARWQLGVLGDLPSEARRIELGHICDEVDRAFEFTKWALPTLSPVNRDYIASALAIDISGTASYTGVIEMVGELGTPRAQEYSKRLNDDLENIRRTQDRPQQVCSALSRIGSNDLLDRFAVADKSYHAAKAGTGERSTAANAIRNLLYGLEGHLWLKARRIFKENMTWEKMAERLSKGEKGTTEQQALLAQGREHTRLRSELSTVLKDREGRYRRNLDLIWAEVLDHFIVVLSLTKL